MTFDELKTLCLELNDQVDFSKYKNRLVARKTLLQIQKLAMKQRKELAAMNKKTPGGVTTPMQPTAEVSE